MRNFVLLLVLANVVFFLYAQYVEQPSVDTGIVLRTEAELTPEAELYEPPPEPVPACYRLGYFDSTDAAEAAIRSIDGLPDNWQVAEATQSIFVGFWVQVVNLRTESEARTYQTRLQNGGVEESYRTGDANEGYTLSLGLFSERDRAERVLKQATDLNVPATIIERYRPEPGAVVTIELLNPAVLDALVAGSESLTVSDCAASEEEEADSEAVADPE
ncbi:MAG: SPOR domain-containing protein [Pseudomonadota bacterium]